MSSGLPWRGLPAEEGGGGGYGAARVTRGDDKITLWSNCKARVIDGGDRLSLLRKYGFGNMLE